MPPITCPQHRRLDSARTRLLLREPFWGALALLLDLQAGPPGSRACTNGKVIRYDPAFIATQPDEVLPMIVREEVEHCARGHLWRAPAGVDHQTWNQACDHEIRNLMVEENEREQAAGRAALWVIPKDCLPDRQYRGMAAEAIYGQLQKRSPQGGGQSPNPPPPPKPGQKPGQGQGQGKNQAPGQAPQPGPQPGQGQGQGTPPPGPGPGSPGSQPGEGGLPGLGDFEPAGGAGASEAEAQQIQGEWERQVVAAARMAKGRGHLPAGMERLVEEIIHPKEDPFHKLQEWLTERAAEDYSWLRPNARYADTGFFLPSLDAPRVGTILFARDTSGSIDQTILARMQGVMQWAMDELRPQRLVSLDCDARVHHCQVFEPGDDIPALDQPAGGGGTSFVPVFERLAEPEFEAEHGPVRALVYLTDLDGRFPAEAPPYPVVWVTWDATRQAPFGHTVRIEL